MVSPSVEQEHSSHLQSGQLSFGRRDRIPPANDPRTKVVDEAMIARGLMTPERLAEIHQVGGEMDRIDPPREHFAQRAEAAVELDREQRRERTRQRKADALRRREERKQEIAHQQASDIIFLGRGVSRSLGNRTSNVDELTRRGLPQMATPADVAKMLNISISRLRWLAFHSVCATRVHYVSFEVAKRSGGARRLAAPHKVMARCQKWINEKILSKLGAHSAAHGFVKRRSIVTNAIPHVDREIVVNLDLEEFFPSITFPRVQGLFQRFGYSPSVATVLALLCTECPRKRVEFNGSKYYVALGERSLPQGACTSPAISNLIAYRLDCRLTGLAGKIGWTYTRYADDLTFSISDGEKSPTKLISVVGKIVEAEGFQLNHKKSRILRRSTCQSVTGVIVNSHPAPRRDLVRQLRAILHRASHEGLAAQNRENRPNYPSWLRGQIAYVSMLNPSQGAKLLQAFLALPAED
ncbi:MAG: reverse transcriptase family protein [Pirellulales bacterium]|nr:reverse transcriptase family protein [Pirellulales bacterium]